MITYRVNIFTVGLYRKYIEVYFVHSAATNMIKATHIYIIIHFSVDFSSLTSALNI